MTGHAIRMRDGARAKAEFRYLGTTHPMWNDQEKINAHTARFIVYVLADDVPPDAPSNMLCDYQQVKCEGHDERSAKLILADKMTDTLRKFGYEPDLTEFLA